MLTAARDRTSPARHLTLLALVALASCVVSQAASAATPGAPLTVSTAGIAASNHSLGIAANGDRTLTWAQAAGSGSGREVIAARITTTQVVTWQGSGRNRRKVIRSVTETKRLVLESIAGRSVSEVVAATTPGGMTTVAWLRLDEGVGATTSQVIARRIGPKGAIGPEIPITAAGLRAGSLAIASSSNGVTTLAWRANDGNGSWISTACIDASGVARVPVDLTPSTGSAFSPSVAAAPDGSGFVAWRDNGGARPLAKAVKTSPTGVPGTLVDLGNPLNQTASPPRLAPGPGGTAAATWSEWNGSAFVVRMAWIRSDGAKGATADVTSAGQPDLPAVTVGANGVATVAWLYGNSEALRVGAMRVTQSGSKSRGYALGPGAGSAVGTSPPSVATTSNGATTVTWSNVLPGAQPQRVDLAGVRLDSRGTIIQRVTLAASPTNAPHLAHLPIAVSGPGTMVGIAHLVRNIFASPAALRLTAWS